MAPREFLERPRVKAWYSRFMPKNSIWVPIFTFGPLAVVLAATPLLKGQITLLGALGIFALGLFSWTLLEYILHRFSFHAKKSWHFFGTLSVERHMDHHHEPNQVDYIAAPMAAALPTAILFFFVVWIGTGSLPIASLWASGLSIGYCWYEWIHYFTHECSAKTTIGKFVKRHHLRHHFADDGNFFGVTSPFWDFVFGTYPRTSKKT